MSVVPISSFILTALKIGLVLYASQAAPRLPNAVTGLFQNTFFKIGVVTLVAYLGDVDLQLAVIIAIIFVLGTNLMSGRDMLESYYNVNENPGPVHTVTDMLDNPITEGHAKIMSSLSDNYPGCNNVKIADLLSLFDNDKIKMQDTLRYTIAEIIRTLPEKADEKTRLEKLARTIGLPYNIELTDENAPFIATLLLQYGVKTSETCQPPN